MCGIVGIYSFDSKELREKQASKVLLKQYHRGPDNTSLLSCDDVTLGHNRLSIIDLSTEANQPFVSGCGRYVVVFNGEIYNYLELKSELEYDFRTSSDTEVLLASYIKYGVKCISKFNGMFAFAIYDKLEKTLFCARDRIGEKPFVYSAIDSGFYFASELAALFSLGIFSDEIDEIGVAYSNLRNFLHIPEPYTKYKSIRRLEPAHAMIIKDKKVVKKWCYWSPNMEYDENITKDEVFNVVNNAVKIRERSDVEIATLLSGGVDSSIISSLMVSHGLKPMAFSLKADDEELSRAIKIAKILGLELKTFEYKREAQKELYDRMVKIYGEEVRLLPLTHAARLYEQISSQGIKVVMSGIGADEIFYGYDNSRKQLIFSDIIKFVEILPNTFLQILEKICSKSNDLKLLFELARVKNNNRKGYLYQKEALQKGFLNFNYNLLLDFWSQKVNTKNYIDVSNWLGLIIENAHSITISADLPPMMYGIEARAPFLDVNVVELAFRIDAHKKVGKSINGQNRNKFILKQAFEKIIPNEILYASKKGFGYGIQVGRQEENLFFKKG